MVLAALAVAIMSLVAAILTLKLRFFLARLLTVTAVSLTAAYSIYWWPVWRGADPSEYHAWAPLFIVPLFLAGLLVGAITLVIANLPVR